MLQPRIRWESVPAEEHLPGDGIREPERRGDREDIQTIGRVSGKHADLEPLVNPRVNFRSYSTNGSSGIPLYCDVHVRSCPLELISVDSLMDP